MNSSFDASFSSAFSSFFGSFSFLIAPTFFFYGSFRWLLCHELVSARTADPQSMQADSQGRILQTSLVGGHPTLLEGVRARARARLPFCD